MTGEQMADFASNESQRNETLLRQAQEAKQPTEMYEQRQDNLAALSAQAADLLKTNEQG